MAASRSCTSLLANTSSSGSAAAIDAVPSASSNGSLASGIALLAALQPHQPLKQEPGAGPR